jgi:hypothetical protein
MFGISPLGWVHTLSSVPAIPLAGYMFMRDGRIVPHSVPGRVYFLTMLMGAGTALLVAKEAAGVGIGLLTLFFLIAGYAVGHIAQLGRRAIYIETAFLSLTAFSLMLPAVTETLRRVPDGHPLVTDIHSPFLLMAQFFLLAVLVVGLTSQIIHLRRKARSIG